jgi:hypothetical protein
VRVVARVLLAGLCLLGGACAGRGSDPGLPEPGGELPDVAWAYLRVLVGEDRDTALEEVTVADSPAYLYGLHRFASMEVHGVVNYSIEADGDEVHLCELPSGGGGLRGECLTLGGFRIDGDGLIRTFMIDGVSIDGRIARGRPPGVTVDAMTVVVQTAMVTSEGDLVVAFDTYNGRAEALTIAADGLRYQPAGGPPVRLSDESSWEPVEVPPKTRVLDMPQFPAADLGGALTVTGRAPGGVEIEVEVPVPTPS